MKRFTLALLLVALATTIVHADTVIVDENFDGYADDSALQAVWVPRNGAGDLPPAAGTEFNGILTTDSGLFPGIEGKAVDHIGANINQYTPASGPIADGAEIFPTATESIFLSADIFESGQGNERMSVGLRSRAPSGNLLELGFWNANSCDPTVAGCIPGTSTGIADIPSKGYGYRAILYGAANVGAPLLVEPNWQYFELPQELDRTTDTDDFVSIGDIGDGWHRYMVTISETHIKFEIDLFRDGVRNDTRDDTGVVVGAGTPGVDASQEWEIHSNLTIGYDSLRIGGPSGVTSAGPGAMAFDNILLKLVDVAAGVLGDFNEDGNVDAADYVTWRKNELANNPLPNDNSLTTQAERYDLWTANFGNPPGSGSALQNAAVPEPSTLILVLGTVAALALGRRR